MKKWNADVQIPTDSNYIVLFGDVEFSVSNSGNPMITITPQIKTPSEIDINGEMYNIAGVKCKPRWYTTTVFNEEDGVKTINQEKTKSSRDRLMKEIFGELGLTYEEINWENPDIKILKGKAFYAVVECKPVEKRKTPTQAQIEAAKKAGKRAEGDVMKNPRTGQALVDYWPATDDLFGLCREESVDAPY